MTLNEIRDATGEELIQREKDLRKELFNLRFQRAISGALENPMRIREVKREIARIKTVFNERNTPTLPLPPLRRRDREGVFPDETFKGGSGGSNGL